MHLILQHYAIVIPLLLALIALGGGITYRWIIRRRSPLSQKEPHEFSWVAKLSLLPLVAAALSLLVLVYLMTTIEGNLFALDGLYFSQNILDTLMLRYRQPVYWTILIFIISTHLGYLLGLLGFILPGKKSIPLISFIGSLTLLGIGIYYIS